MTNLNYIIVGMIWQVLDNFFILLVKIIFFSSKKCRPMEVFSQAPGRVQPSAASLGFSELLQGPLSLALESYKNLFLAIFEISLCLES